MVWVRLADDFTDHPKVVAAGPLASWMYVCGLTYANRYLTDGFIPGGQVRRLADVDGALSLADRLVEVGLWERAEGGFQIHDYRVYQPSADDVKRERESTAQRVAEFRRRKAENRNGVTNAVSNAPCTAVPDPDPDPDPLTPVPAVTTPQPPPREGEFPPTPQRGATNPRRRRNGAAAEPAQLLEEAALTPVTTADDAVWNVARPDLERSMSAANYAEHIEPLVPIGRAADGGLHLRAPPGANGMTQRYRQRIVVALTDAGEGAAERVRIVESRSGSTEG